MRALRGAARDVTAAVRMTHARLALIDGRSGAGKTTLAGLLAADWSGVQRLALDDVYPGWDGLDEGVASVLAGVLLPFAAGRPGRWRSWDWDAGAPGRWHDVDAGRPLIVEGCGILTPDTAPLSPVRVWLDAPTRVRRRQALDRDGDDYRPYWQRWAVQDERHVRRDRPQSLATHVFRVG